MSPNTPFHPDITKWRLGNALLAMLPVFLFNAHDVFAVTQVMGPSHALLAFLAQKRMGQYQNKTKAWFFIALFMLAIASGAAFPLHFVFFVSSFFVLHNFLDDIVLFNTVPTWRTQLLTFYATAIFILIDVDSAYNMHLVQAWLPYLALGLPVCIWAMIGQRNTPQFAFLFYMLAMAFVMLALSYLAIGGTPGRLPVENVFCFLVLTHYLNWYVYIYKKKKARTDKPQEVRAYVQQAVGCNAFFLGLYIACLTIVPFDNYAGQAMAIVFVLVFDAIAFHVFTFMHLATTVRINDYIPKLRRGSAP